MKAVLFLIVLICGCIASQQVQQPETNYTHEEIQTTLYEPVNYPPIMDIETNDIGHPTLLKNPIMQMPIKYYFTTPASPDAVKGVTAGMHMWKAVSITFEEAENLSDATLVISIVSDNSSNCLGWHTLGRGGPVSYIELRNYSIITKAQLYLVT